ncbi:P23 [Mycoplasma phage P1]|uniref:P23 n=1 Tax=Mycoplasma phage P1 TaxID=2905920 RepID=Q9FZR3_9CAUD|nr:P23 [Mycoplasma phage P1]AAG01281.1 P23 [Mycoplasma phage P1]
MNNQKIHWIKVESLKDANGHKREFYFRYLDSYYLFMWDTEHFHYIDEILIKIIEPINSIWENDKLMKFNQQQFEMYKKRFYEGKKVHPWNIDKEIKQEVKMTRKVDIKNWQKDVLDELEHQGNVIEQIIHFDKPEIQNKDCRLDLFLTNGKDRLEFIDETLKNMRDNIKWLKTNILTENKID